MRRGGAGNGAKHFNGFRLIFIEGDSRFLIGTVGNLRGSEGRINFDWIRQGSAGCIWIAANLQHFFLNPQPLPHIGIFFSERGNARLQDLQWVTNTAIITHILRRLPRRQNPCNQRLPFLLVIPAVRTVLGRFNHRIAEAIQYTPGASAEGTAGIGINQG